MALLFLDLPDDLLHGVLLELDYISILACQNTCGKLKALVDGSMRLQYSIELGASAMCEGPAARHLDVSERLQRLREYEAARERDIKFEELPFVPDLVGDVWNLRTSGTTLVLGDEWDEETQVYVQQMPSTMRGIEERHWSVKLAHAYRLAAVDASQDLLVVTQNGSDPTVIRMLTLSTGQPHPLSSGHATLVAPGDVASRVEVFGDYCAAMSHATGHIPSLIVWNWITGTIEVQIRSSESRSKFTSQSQITFLSDTYIAVLSCESEAILVYAFRAGMQGTSQSGEHQATTPAVFMLPTPHPWLPACLALSSSVSGTEHVGLFHPAPSARLLSLAIFVSLPGGQKFQRLSLAIPADSLLTRMSSQADVLPWAAWGPAKSCLAHCVWEPETPAGVGVTAMRDVVVGNDFERPDGVPVFALADFCQARVARGRLLRKGGTVVECFETTAEEGLLKTTLPYLLREFSTPWGSEDIHRLHKIILCEDQLFVSAEQYTADERPFKKAWACTV
ncbi:hypothetical protein FA95DRAFT_713981 [Auriscalpium vulgare]|uniref:Uncharacterized protein n=1 Tax=Auriscalpium vulgare TaxID=40419 RepID=A0ACB8RBB9_9AGAM|nr:hypothetical protein FA95DRAFT_713981 [Auriscalpium vulgare]